MFRVPSSSKPPLDVKHQPQSMQVDSAPPEDELMYQNTSKRLLSPVANTEYTVNYFEAASVVGSSQDDENPAHPVRSCHRRTSENYSPNSILSMSHSSSESQGRLESQYLKSNRPDLSLFDSDINGYHHCWSRLADKRRSHITASYSMDSDNEYVRCQIFNKNSSWSKQKSYDDIPGRTLHRGTGGSTIYQCADG